MEHFLNAQHCLTIAAAFIAIVAACATLINIANSKADSLATRYREATKEYRDATKSQNSQRATQLQKQIELFVKRTRQVSWAQRHLFFTIGIFIASIAVFIGLALYLVYFNITDETAHVVARVPIIVIGVFVAVGTFCMFVAIILQYLELGDAARTFDIETKDCRVRAQD